MDLSLMNVSMLVVGLPLCVKFALAFKKWAKSVIEAPLTMD